MTTQTLHIYAIQKTNNSQQSVYLHVPVNIIDSAFPLFLNEAVLALGCSAYDTLQNYDMGEDEPISLFRQSHDPL